jgi:hypothetical protein
VVGRVGMKVGFDFLHTQMYYLAVEAQFAVLAGFYKNFVMFLGNCFFLAAGKVNFELVGKDFGVSQKGGILLD